MAQPPITRTAAEAGSSPAERAALGKAARERVPRSAHGDWEPAADRADPVDDAREPGRHPGRRSSSRSATAGCASRRSPSTAAPRRSWPPTSPSTPTTGLWVQACGDAHLSNFGGFASPEPRPGLRHQRLRRDPPGPWEWDVKRLAASFEIAARDHGFDAKRAARWSDHAARLPRRRCGVRRRSRNLDVWYRAGRRRRDLREQLPAATPASASARLRRRRSPRPSARTACGRSRSSPSGSTASCGSSATRR